jgi:methionine synthase I (cobalamin-dependent)
MVKNGNNNMIFFVYVLSYIYNYSEFNSQGQSILPFIRSYIDAGVKYIGGCCHVNPSQIHSMRDIIDGYMSLTKT